MRGDVHRDQECLVHTGTALIETTSGDQLVCPRLDCWFYKTLVGGKWKAPARVGVLARVHEEDVSSQVITKDETALRSGARERRVAERTQKRSPRR